MLLQLRAPGAAHRIQRVAREQHHDGLHAAAEEEGEHSEAANEKR